MPVEGEHWLKPCVAACQSAASYLQLKMITLLQDVQSTPQQ